MLDINVVIKAIQKKKIIYFKHSKNTNFIKIIIIILLLNFMIFKNFFHIKNLFIIQDIIIESKDYKKFNKLIRKSTSPFVIKMLKEIKIIRHIFVKNIESYKKKKNIIHISVSLNKNKNYKYVLLVSMYSLLLNCNNSTFVIYHILCTPDFDEASIIIFKSLLNKFSPKVEMIFYNMGNIFKNRKNCMYSEATYYRLMLPIILDEERILNLDGDTLTFSDLNELYNLDFKDNYILGFYDYSSWGVDYLGIKSKSYINAGVILLNLKKIREDKKDLLLFKLPYSKIELKKDDQTVFNYLLYPKIGRLPSKYVTFNFEDKSDIIFYSKFLRTNISIEDMENSLKNPIIIHNVICSPKVWYNNTQYIKGAGTCSQRKNCSCRKYFDLWHNFAKQTEYYENISKFTFVKN